MVNIGLQYSTYSATNAKPINHTLRRTKMARTRKLEKSVDYDKGIVKVKVISTGKEIVCDVSTLPKEIQAKLIPFAISHRIGDAAAGRDGDEALEAMTKVWEGLVAGNFTIRQPATKGLTKKDISEKLAALKGPEATAAAALLEKLGISL